VETEGKAHDVCDYMGEHFGRDRRRDGSFGMRRYGGNFFNLAQQREGAAMRRHFGIRRVVSCARALVCLCAPSYFMVYAEMLKQRLVRPYEADAVAVCFGCRNMPSMPSLTKQAGGVK
jgi:hypothetical protein